MEPCVQSPSLTGPCAGCGARGKEMHRPLFRRGSYCPRCCPVCAAKPAPAPATPLAKDVAAEGTTQWKDEGWGPFRDARGRCIDPWYRDERRFPPPWIPRRPKLVQVVKHRLLIARFATLSA
jgi:hypothetical protein